jgi:hypothetical protein
MRKDERDRYLAEQSRLKRLASQLRRKARDPAVTPEERAALEAKARELRQRISP